MLPDMFVDGPVRGRAALYPTFWLVPSQGANDTGSFATLANYFTTTDSFEIDAIVAGFNAAAIGDVYSAFVATADGSHNITGTVVSAQSRFTTTATGRQHAVFSIPRTILGAGASYLVGLVITSGIGTTACRALITSGSVGTFDVELPSQGVAMPPALITSTGRAWFTQNSDAPSSATKASSAGGNNNYWVGLRVLSK
ncbi:hypothetical protein MPL3356_390159 [Mesorhizobium plurifarium]|uniref:Uncharacterized protein n=1 Tax=Mesorhizobium plurifarium TaxID=69974 RepID=A0A090E4N2_MESPL|nr:hypothetical protein MPL3356_390159 [Mesorhizobium plurifarium]